MDPLAGSNWSTRETVAGFAQSGPNQTLMRFAAEELQQRGRLRVLDLGCGAGRNAIPLAGLGADVLGVDLSSAMLAAARDRARAQGPPISLALAPMDALPVRGATIDLIVAHGIWNLAHSAAEFRHALAEGARTGKSGASLFVFTFARRTLPDDAEPVAGEPFVFTQFANEPQCFLTEAQLIAELREAGFEPDPRLPLRELKLNRPGALPAAARVPVIFEGAFRLG